MRPKSFGTFEKQAPVWQVKQLNQIVFQDEQTRDRKWISENMTAFGYHTYLCLFEKRQTPVKYSSG